MMQFSSEHNFQDQPYMYVPTKMSSKDIQSGLFAWTLGKYMETYILAHAIGKHILVDCCIFCATSCHFPKKSSVWKRLVLLIRALSDRLQWCRHVEKEWPAVAAHLGSIKYVWFEHWYGVCEVFVRNLRGWNLYVRKMPCESARN